MKECSAQVIENIDNLKELLKSFGFYTSKDLGQNFLVNADVLDVIINSVKISKDTNIIEIGPGPGALTNVLLESDAQKITALEIDERVIPILEYTTGGVSQRLAILHQNALDYTIKDSDSLLIANIPYYLTSPILRHYLTQKNKLKEIVLLIQKEVAEKICSPKQSILSLQVAIYGKAEILCQVPANNFFPAPKVDSAVIKISVYQDCLIPEDKLKKFWSITKQAFSQSRKKISNTLGKQLYSGTKTVNNLFKQLEIDSNRRPETLSIEEWRKILDNI